MSVDTAPAVITEPCVVDGMPVKVDGRKNKPVRPLFDRLIEKLDIGDCWIFTGARYENGYGAINSGRRGPTRVAHKALWEILVGPVPDGMDLDHLCRNRPCCNPDHLQPVTRQVNVDRGAQGSGRPRRTACRRGHEFTPENTGRTNRQRYCRTCRRDGELQRPAAA